MASAEELIHEAYFAFQNISPGATDEKKYRARAKKYAMRILRRYPVSVEARQARSILDQLKIDHAQARFVEAHSHSDNTTQLAMPTTRPHYAPAMKSGDTDWKSLWHLFTRLPQLQQRILAFILLFILLLAAFTPFMLVFAFLLIMKRDAAKQLIHKVLLSMDPNNPPT